MIAPRILVDYSIFEKKMGKLGTKVIPRARITAQIIAKYGLKAVILFTLRTPVKKGRGGSVRTSGRQHIADLWQLSHDRRATMDVYTIRNLYPRQEVIVYFEEGTRGHDIKPVRRQSLHWYDEDSGADVFSKGVYNPGMAATRMVERAERDVIKPRVELWMRETLALVDKEMR